MANPSHRMDGSSILWGPLETNPLYLAFLRTYPMSDTLPPLMFTPRFVEKLWGGRRLETSLNKRLPEKANIGESWEVFDFPPGTVEGNKEWLSATIGGGELKGKTLHDLMLSSKEALLGAGKAGTGADGTQFPLLIKFLDAREDLSIQVHPTPEYAKSHEGAYLKTECWIVMDHEPGAFLYKSLKPGVTKAQFETAMKDGKVAELVGTVPAEKGDCHFLPSGAVHALGAGVLVAEVQTPSDTTYRVFDFNRIEKATGKPRKLHLKEALECVNFEDPSTPAVTSTRNTAVPLVDCEFFKTTTVKLPAHGLKPLPKGQMKIWMLTEGSLKLRWGTNSLNVNKGQTVLIPASVVAGLTANVTSNATILETVLP